MFETYEREKESVYPIIFALQGWTPKGLFVYYVSPLLGG
jgi:hypothetical protein